MTFQSQTFFTYPHESSDKWRIDLARKLCKSHLLHRTQVFISKSQDFILFFIATCQQRRTTLRLCLRSIFMPIFVELARGSRQKLNLYQFSSKPISRWRGLIASNVLQTIIFRLLITTQASCLPSLHALANNRAALISSMPLHFFLIKKNAHVNTIANLLNDQQN